MASRQASNKTRIAIQFLKKLNFKNKRRSLKIKAKIIAGIELNKNEQISKEFRKILRKNMSKSENKFV